MEIKEGWAGLRPCALASAQLGRVVKTEPVRSAGGENFEKGFVHV